MEEEKEEMFIEEQKKQIDYDCCKFCNNTFSSQEEQSGEKIMLVETGCFHFLHKACLIEIVFKNPDKIQCPAC